MPDNEISVSLSDDERINKELDVISKLKKVASKHKNQ